MEYNEKQQELYSIALKVFSEYGFKKATVEEIASRMWLTKGALYQYVKSKRDLYEKSVRNSMYKWHKKVESAIMKEEDIEKKFVALCKSAFYYLDQDTQLKKIMVKDPEVFPMSFKDDPYREIHEKSMVFIKNILDEGIKQNKFKEMDTTMITKILFNTFKMLIITTYLFEEQDAKNILEATIETVTKGFYNQQ